MKIGLITDCLKMPTLEEALAVAKEIGVEGVQIYVTRGELTPEATPEYKAKIKKLINDYGFTITGFVGDGGGTYEHEDKNPAIVERVKKIIDLAVEFGTKVVTTHIGVIPDDKADPTYAVMLKAVTECGLYAKERGVMMAIETGPEKATTLKAFIEDTKGGVGVNLDPANFTMVTEQDAVEAVYLLKDHIVHTHAKDGRKLQPGVPPAAVYHGTAVGRVYADLPLGEGDVNWDAYLAALKDVGYDGFLTIEREAGDDRVGDMTKAAAFLKSKLN